MCTWPNTSYILARDESAALSDNNTFDVLHRLMELKLSQRCVVESVRDENRARLNKLEPKSILRPVRTYPEIIITAMLAPGSEKVLEDLILRTCIMKLTIHSVTRFSLRILLGQTLFVR